MYSFIHFPTAVSLRIGFLTGASVICDLCIWNQFLNVNILKHSHFFEDKRNLPTLKHLEEILSMYSGSIENGQMHGHGKLQYANGDVFEV
jgi:hypothetical protein